MTISLIKTLSQRTLTHSPVRSGLNKKLTGHLNLRRTFLNKVSPHPQRSLLWWKDFTIVMTVFAVTGSASVYLTRPFISKGLGLEGSLKEGPWTYWVSYVLIGLPTYSTMLLVFGTLSGKGAYFKPIAKRMWTRLLPKRLASRLFD